MKESGKSWLIRTESREKDGISYKYDLSMKKNGQSDCRTALYSISVEMTQQDGLSTTHSKSDELFTDERRAVLFFEKIVDNLATPIDLAYVTEDEFGK